MSIINTNYSFKVTINVFTSCTIHLIIDIKIFNIVSSSFISPSDLTAFFLMELDQVVVLRHLKELGYENVESHLLQKFMKGKNIVNIYIM